MAATASQVPGASPEFLVSKATQAVQVGKAKQGNLVHLVGPDFPVKRDTLDSKESKESEVPAGSLDIRGCPEGQVFSASVETSATQVFRV